MWKQADRRHAAHGRRVGPATSGPISDRRQLREVCLEHLAQVRRRVAARPEGAVQREPVDQGVEAIDLGVGVTALAQRAAVRELLHRTAHRRSGLRLSVVPDRGELGIGE